MAIGVVAGTLLGIVGCVFLVALFAFVAHENLKKETFFSKLTPRTAKIGAGILTCLMIASTMFLYVLPFKLQGYSLYSSEAKGPIFIGAILLVLILPAVIGCWMLTTERRSMLGNKKFFGQLTFVSGALAMFLLFNTCTTMVVYGTKTIRNENYAADHSTFYHGPAPIVGRYTSAGTYSARVNIAYSGTWACPQNPTKETCVVEASLSPCSEYDESSRWAYWRYWKGVDHWANTFSCAEGPQDDNTNDAADDDEEDKDDDGYGYDSFVDDAFDGEDYTSDWPYQIQIIADCRTTCLIAVDDLLTRDKLFAVERLKLHMILNTVAAMFFLCGGPLLRRISKQTQEENSQLLANENKKGAMA